MNGVSFGNATSCRDDAAGREVVMSRRGKQGRERTTSSSFLYSSSSFSSSSSLRAAGSRFQKRGKERKRGERTRDASGLRRLPLFSLYRIAAMHLRPFHEEAQFRSCAGISVKIRQQVPVNTQRAVNTREKHFRSVYACFSRLF